MKENAMKTFLEAAKEYEKNYGETWSDNYRKMFWGRLNNHAAKLLSMDVKDIDSNLVFDTVRKIWIDKYATAKELSRELKAIMMEVMATDYTDTIDFKVNKLDARLKKIKNIKIPIPFQSLDFEKMPCFAKVLFDQGKGGDQGALFVLFIMLSGVRYNEAHGAKWRELGGKGNLWVIPRERMKGKEGKKKMHTVPISEGLQSVLELLVKNEDEENIFDQKIYPLKALKKLREVCLECTDIGDENQKELCSKITVHGLRAAFRAWIAKECPEVPFEIAEEALSHVLPGQVAKKYLRNAEYLDMPIYTKERIDIMEKWSEYLLKDGVSST